MVRPLAIFGFGAVLCFALATTLARASVDAESRYTKTQTYNGALRYLRVDLGYEVMERDPDAAYLLFRFFPDGNKKTPSTGSIEIVEQSSTVRLYVRLQDLPRYHEELLSDGLMRKLRDEYGEPPPKHEEAPPKERKKRASDQPDGGS